MMERPYSEQISDFLTFLRATVEQANMCAMEEQETNKQTQDILHSLELEAHSYNEMARIAKKLRDVRQRRREAKNIQMSADIVAQWCEDNRQVIKSLERLLGDVRKAEKKVEDQVYFNRTSVMEEIK